MLSKIIALVVLVVSFVYCAKKPVNVTAMTGEKSVAAMDRSEPCHG